METGTYEWGMTIGYRNLAERMKHRKRTVPAYFVEDGFLWVLESFVTWDYDLQKPTTKLRYFPYRGLCYVKRLHGHLPK